MAMDFYDVLKKRRSFRAYDPNRSIPDDALMRIMEAVQCAPSACNRQPWRFEIIFNRELRQKISAATRFDSWLKDAPAIVVALADYSSCWVRPEGTPAAEIDMAIAMEHLVLAAAAEDLGSCWICAYEKARLNQVLGVEAPWSVEAVSPLGYAVAAPRDLNYKSIDEIFKVVR